MGIDEIKLKKACKDINKKCEWKDDTDTYGKQFPTLVYKDKDNFPYAPCSLPCSIKSTAFKPDVKRIIDDNIGDPNLFIGDPNSLKNKNVLDKLANIKYDDKFKDDDNKTITGNLKDTNNVKDLKKIKRYPKVDVKKYIKDYNALMTTNKKNNKFTDIDKEEFKALNTIKYWNPDAAQYAYDTKDVNTELYNLLKLKLPSTHHFFIILDKDNEKTFQIIFKEIRKNTMEFIGTYSTSPYDLYTFIDKYSNKLTLLEIELYIEKTISEDVDETDETDVDPNKVYESMLDIYIKNKNFRICIDNKLNEEDIKIVLDHGKKDLSILSRQDFNKYKKSLVSILETIKDMNMYTIYACVDKIMKPSEICDGKLIEQYLKLLNVLYEYVNIKTNFNTKDIKRVNTIIKETSPHVKQIFKNLIEYTKLYPGCGTENNKKKIRIYDTIYSQLFEKNDPVISYNLFDNINWKDNFLFDLTNSFTGQIILLIFFAFIFSQLISMYKPVHSSINTTK